MRDADAAVIDRVGDRGLPETTADALLGGRPLLVLAPHPDDESLGCGALLAHAFAGPGAHVIALTDGSASHPGSRAMPPAQLAAIRREEMLEAVSCLDGAARDVTFLDAPDAALEASGALVDRVTELARAGGCGFLLAPSPLDPHCDHVEGAAIGQEVGRRLPGLRLGFYPIWSRWHGGGCAPVPPGTRAVRVPPGLHTVAKAAAIAAHRSQAGLVVPDDPGGFEMPEGFAAFFAERDEIYLLAVRDWGPS